MSTLASRESWRDDRDDDDDFETDRHAAAPNK